MNKILALPGSNAAVKRIFGHKLFFWTKETNMLCVDLVKAILTDKTNFAFSCQEITKKLPAATHRLKEIHRSQKYH